MGDERDHGGPRLNEGQEAVVASDEGALLVLGVAGSGRTEALARRLARLVGEAERALAMTRSVAAARRIRLRAEATIETGYEELVVHTHPVAAARLLREHATEAEVDPFFESLNPAERLAMLLDRIDELPLRRHEIRGNPAGLLARIVERIDALKSAGVTAERFGRWADEQAGGTRSERDSAAREREFAEIYELHDSMLRSAGAMDDIDGVLELTRLLGERPALTAAIAERFPHLIVDELEDACPAERSLIEALARGAASTVALLRRRPGAGALRCGGGLGPAGDRCERGQARAELALRRRPPRCSACRGGARGAGEPTSHAGRPGRRRGCASGAAPTNAPRPRRWHVTSRARSRRAR